MARADNYLLAITAADRPPDHLDEAIEEAARSSAAPRFCHLLSASAPSLPAKAWPAHAHDDTTSEDVDGDWIRADSDIPWLTLVIGAECLQLQTSGFDRHAVLGELHDAWNEASDVEEGIDPIVERFIWGLIDDRLGGKEVRSQEGVTACVPRHATRFGGWWLPFFVVTALLNEASSTARYLWHPANHWGESVVILRLPEPDEQTEGKPAIADMTNAKAWLTTILGWLEPRQAGLEKALGEAKKHTGQRVSPAAVLPLVTRIRNDLDSLVVSNADIQSMTEVCWSRLAQGYDLYPAWDEMLVDLALAPGGRGIRRAYPRPAFLDTGGAVKVLRSTLEPISQASQQGYRVGGDALENDRDRAYKQFADLLVAEAAIARRTRNPNAGDLLAHRHQGVNATFTGPIALQEYGDAAGLDEDPPTHEPEEATPAPEPEERPGWRLKAERLKGVKAPAAVAFVTTFDVELEMGLKYRHPDQPFVVALPVHLFRADAPEGERDRATSVWLGYVVRPSSSPPDDVFAAVTTPTLDDWFVLSSIDLEQPPEPDRNGRDVGRRAFAVVERAFDITDAGQVVSRGTRVDAPAELPIIVRMSGSPLVTLPSTAPTGPGSFGSELRNFAMRLAVDEDVASGDATPTPDAESTGEDLGQLQAMHAILLEEHQALRLALPEIEVSRSTARGLPRLLTHLGSDGFRRYWTLLGVPLSDTVSRIRLMAQLMSAGLMDPRGSGYRHPKNRGIALNRARTSSRARDMLQWVEFMELGGSPGDLTETDGGTRPSHLQHYIAHLTKDDSSLVTWPPERTECESV